MSLRLLEAIASVDGTKPRLEEEPRPLRIPDNEARRRQAFLVLGNHQVNVLALKVRERLDNTVRRDDRVVADHDGLEIARLHQIALHAHGRAHEQRVLLDEPEVRCVRELGQRGAQGDHLRPGHRCALEVEVAHVREEGLVACPASCQYYPLLVWLCATITNHVFQRMLSCSP